MQPVKNYWLANVNFLLNSSARLTNLPCNVLILLRIFSDPIISALERVCLLQNVLKKNSFWILFPAYVRNAAVFMFSFKKFPKIY